MDYIQTSIFFNNDSKDLKDRRLDHSTQYTVLKIRHEIQVHLNKLECREIFFSCNLFQKVKRLKKKKKKKKKRFLELTAHKSQKSVYQNIRIFTFEFQLMTIHTV